ncbi:hypothetical protein [Nocardioides insulae]|uniref:hypothetical protein n=1 Tax=Nocardioides insulae TaxID=394734 RepID=UPI00041A0CFB|nr:hypothetical protein [Nocardioides insulae]
MNTTSTSVRGTPPVSQRRIREDGGAHPYAGYAALLRLALRRDRIRLPAWVLGIGLMTGYFANAIQVAYPEESDLEAITGFMEAPAGLVMSGPGYGVEDPSYPIVFAMIYAVWLMLAAAFLNILLVGRHTRAEEEAGRLELVRANVVGRHAPLAVAATLAIGANLALFLLSWVLLSAAGYPSAGSALMGASIAMVGLVFAGLAAVINQLTEHSRSATGAASLMVALAMVIRGAGDDSIAGAMGDLSNQLVIDAMGGDADNLVDGYLGTCAMFNAFMVACYALTAAHRLTREEAAGRTEVMLAGSVARVRWMGAALLTTLLATTTALLGAGLGMGLGAAAVTGEWSYLGSMLGAHLVFLPAIAVVLAVAAAGYAVRPSWLNLAWVVAVYGMVIGFLGSMLDLPDWTTDLSPFGSIALVPLEEQSATPLVVLVIVAVVVVVAALVRFRRRDLVTG